MGRQSPYANAFKADALRRLREDGITVAALARELSVDVTTIRHWKKEARMAQSSPAPTALPMTLEETQQALVRSNEIIKRQQMEIDILKKAMGILSRMPQ